MDNNTIHGSSTPATQTSAPQPATVNDPANKADIHNTLATSGEEIAHPPSADRNHDISILSKISNTVTSSKAYSTADIEVKAQIAQVRDESRR